MGRERYVPRPFNCRVGEPFLSAEEAWFWYCQCQMARLDGARFSANNNVLARPCDPDDIYLAVDQLYRERRIDRRHLVVLADYGQRLTPPDPRREGDAARCWQEAMDRLIRPLRLKGILL